MMKRLTCGVLFAGVLLAPTVFAGPPAGRPPIGPLERYDPQLYEVQYDVLVRTKPSVVLTHRQRFRFDPMSIVMPVIGKSTFSTSIDDSISVQAWIGNREIRNISTRREPAPMNTQTVLIPMPAFEEVTFRWAIKQRFQVWNSRIPNERAMTELTWPREWPADVGDALKPQPYIESNDAIFQQAVKNITNDRLRLVTPYLAAKELLRAMVHEIQLNGDALRETGAGELQGFAVTGASGTARQSMGTPNDLVCVCVAVLKAAGIPARPVIGIDYHDRKDSRQGKLRAWGELYIDGAGWIPFDPEEMRNGGVRHMDVYARWPGLGTFEHFNERIPLAYQFVPPGTVSPCVFVGGWGLQIQPMQLPEVEQRISLTVSELGQGVDD